MSGRWAALPDIGVRCNGLKTDTKRTDIYALEMARATRAGCGAISPSAFYPDAADSRIQRCLSVWTGDNVVMIASENCLSYVTKYWPQRRAVRPVANVGGFVGNPWKGFISAGSTCTLPTLPPTLTLDTHSQRAWIFGSESKIPYAIS